MGVRPSSRWMAWAASIASSSQSGGPASLMLSKVSLAMTWLGNPGRDFTTQVLRQRQWLALAAASALLSRARETCSAISIVGTRQIYWIWERWAGRLSAVAWPAVRIASLIDQPWLKGSVEAWS